VNQYVEKGSQFFVEGELRGDASEPLDKHRCHDYLLNTARSYEELGVVNV